MSPTKEKPEKKKSRADNLFGQIAMGLEIVSREQLQEAVQFQQDAKEYLPLGKILIQLGHVTEENLKRIIDAQHSLLEQRAERDKAVREDNLFGKVALRLEFITDDELNECIEYQAKLPPDRFRRLGDILVAFGYITPPQIRTIIEMQKGFLLYCPGCETQYNVVLFKPGASLFCYRCGAPMRIPLWYQADIAIFEELIASDEEKERQRQETEPEPEF